MSQGYAFCYIFNQTPTYILCVDGELDMQEGGQG